MDWLIAAAWSIVSLTRFTQQLTLKVVWKPECEEFAREARRGW